ncbi:MAG: DsbA family protein, partial [Myxococcales bacterium]
ALVLLVAGGFATGLSVVLGVVSATSIGVLCPLCAVLYGISLGLLGTGIWATRSAGEPLRESLRGERRFWRQRQGRVALALGVPALVLFVAWGVWPRGFAPVANLCQFTRARAAAGETGPIELVVYSDFQCPWCEKANDALERLRASGRARVEHRHYPLDQECNRAMRRQMHPGACTQAKAAICAEKLGRGSEMAGRIFSKRLSDPAALAEAAAGLGLDRAAFEACLSSRETALELDRHMDAADAQGVTGTPTVFVNGRKLEGMLDAENVACLLRG